MRLRVTSRDLSLSNSNPPAALLEIEDLRVRYNPGQAGSVAALRGLSMRLSPGEALGIVGETGSGKSTLAHTLLGLVPAASVEGTISFDGSRLPVRDEAAMRNYRWRRIALVF